MSIPEYRRRLCDLHFTESEIFIDVIAYTQYIYIALRHMLSRIKHKTSRAIKCGRVDDVCI